MIVTIVVALGTYAVFEGYTDFLFTCVAREATIRVSSAGTVAGFALDTGQRLQLVRQILPGLSFEVEGPARDTQSIGCFWII